MPVDLSKKKRVMINLDRAIAMLIEEAAALDRRTVAQYLTLLIEDTMQGMADTDPEKLQQLWQNVGEKIAAMEDKEDRSRLAAQADVYLKQLKAKIN